MGNTNNGFKESPLKTWAVANYTSLTREQLFKLRDICFQIFPEQRRINQAQPYHESDKENMRSDSHLGIAFPNHSMRANMNYGAGSLFLSRKRLSTCLRKAGITEPRDREIICDLHTMWDEDNTNQIPAFEFLVSLCPLVCDSNTTSRMFFQFVLEFYDMKTVNYIRPNDLIIILESLNVTLLFLGDESLRKKQIKNVVFELVQSASLVDEQHKQTIDADDEDFVLSFEDVVTMLAVDPIIRKLLAQKLKSKHRVSFAPHVSVAGVVAGQWLFMDDDFSTVTDLSSITDGQSRASWYTSEVNIEAKNNNTKSFHKRNSISNSNNNSRFGDEVTPTVFRNIFGHPATPRPNKAQLEEIANEELLTTEVNGDSHQGTSNKGISVIQTTNPLTAVTTGPGEEGIREPLYNVQRNEEPSQEKKARNASPRSKVRAVMSSVVTTASSRFVRQPKVRAVSATLPAPSAQDQSFSCSSLSTYNQHDYHLPNYETDSSDATATTATETAY